MSHIPSVVTHYFSTKTHITLLHNINNTYMQFEPQQISYYY